MLSAPATRSIIHSGSLAAGRAQTRHEIFRAETLRALKVDDKLFNRAFVQVRFGGREIDQVVRMDEDGDEDGNITVSWHEYGPWQSEWSGSMLLTLDFVLNLNGEQGFYILEMDSKIATAPKEVEERKQKEKLEKIAYIEKQLQELKK